MRPTTTLRGGDRPKGYEDVYPGVITLPQSRFEPWGLFRKPFNVSVGRCLELRGTGGLSRFGADGHVLTDVLSSFKTSKAERQMSPHPNLKPQALMRHIVKAVLPLKGRPYVVLDPFMGGGSTIAACEALGVDSVGLELDAKFFDIAKKAIPSLASLQV